MNLNYGLHGQVVPLKASVLTLAEDEQRQSPLQEAGNRKGLGFKLPPIVNLKAECFHFPGTQPNHVVRSTAVEAIG